HRFGARLRHNDAVIADCRLQIADSIADSICNQSAIYNLHSAMSSSDSEQLAVGSPVPRAADERRRRQHRRVQLVDAEQLERASRLDDERLTEIVREKNFVADRDG